MCQHLHLTCQYLRVLITLFFLTAWFPALSNAVIECFGPLPNAPLPKRLPVYDRSNGHLGADDQWWPKDPTLNRYSGGSGATFDPGGFTLTEMCSTSGGRPINQTVGAYATSSREKIPFPQSMSGPVTNVANPVSQIEFDIRTQGPLMWVIRFFLYCQMRCFDRSDTRRGLPPLRKWSARGDYGLISYPSPPPHEVEIGNAGWKQEIRRRRADDPNNDQLSQRVGLRWRPDPANPSIPAGSWMWLDLTPSARTLGSSELSYVYFTLPHTALIECDDGPLPTELDPYRESDFPTLLSFCAVALSGGNRNVNAGGFCAGQWPYKDVWFTDEMTPHLPYTWNSPHGDSRKSWQARAHCWHYCRCKNAPPIGLRPMARFWFKLVSEGFITLSPPVEQEINQIIDLVDSTDSTFSSLTSDWNYAQGSSLRFRGPDTLEIVSENDGATTVRKLAQGTKVFPWPADILGPHPRGDAKSSGSDSGVQPNSQSTPLRTKPLNGMLRHFPSLATCGSSCQSNRDCAAAGETGNSDAIGACRCVAMTKQIKNFLSVDAAAALAQGTVSALCLNLANVLSAGRSRGMGMRNRGKGRRLVRRSAEIQKR